MKSTTAKYKQIVASGATRKYLVTINLILADNTQLTLTEADIWGDSLTIETASSGTDTFDLGCAVIGRCKFSIENHDERFSSYDFFNATAVVWLKLDGDTTYYRMGFFTVDEPKGSSSLITLELLDNMWKFDTDLPTLTMPAALGTIVNDLCIHCGVTLATQNFRGYNYTLSELPDEEMNCRELLQYVAMIGCNFCVINASGSLDIRWYDEIPAYDHLACVGDYVGVYVNSSNENTYANIDRFMRNYEVAIGTGDITITGVKITIDDTDYQIGSAGYMLKIENPLVTVDNVSAILNLIWGRLAGFTFRTFDVTMLSDLAVEVGDACAIRDIKGNIIYSIVTNNSFELSTHSVSTGAVTPTRSLTTRYSREVQAAVQIARNNTNQIISDYDLAVQMMNNLAIHAMGAYQEYEDLATGGRVYYLSNKPITKDAQGHCVFTAGSSVFKATGDGFFVSVDGGQTWINGYNTHTGELVVNVLYTIGLHADWIKTGQLTVGGSTAIYIGTETQDSFRFTPYDSYISEDCVLKLYLGYSGAGIESTVTITLHQNGADTLIGTYTLENGDYGVETAMIDHTVGSTSGDYYLITISGNSPVTITVGLPQKPKLVVLDAANQPVCTIDERGIIMGSGYISSSDYADTSPVSPYSSTGMKIDVNNKYIKSPYFGIDMNGAHLKGEVEASSGKIGAATITSNSVKIIGDIELYSGTGTFTFRPYDYYFAADFKLSLEAVNYTSGTATVTIVKHENDVDTTVGTYTIINATPVLSATLDHTIGLDPDDYYRITISGFNIAVSAHEVLLAYMGHEGFRGILEGIFKGYLDATGIFHGELDSEKGIIAGFNYQPTGKFTHSNDIVDWNNHRTYNTTKSMGWTPNGFHFVDKESEGHCTVGYAIDNGFDDSSNEGVTDLISVAPNIFINLNKTSNQATATITRKQNYNGQTEAHVVWSDEIQTEVGGLYTITPNDPGEGVPLAAGHFILVIESDD